MDKLKENDLDRKNRVEKIKFLAMLLERVSSSKGRDATFPDRYITRKTLKSLGPLSPQERDFLNAQRAVEKTRIALDVAMEKAANIEGSLWPKDRQNTVTESAKSAETTRIVALEESHREVLREHTPLGRLVSLVWRENAIAGGLNRPLDLTAYVLACLSELSYLALSARELDERGRYKLFTPCLAAVKFKEAGLSLQASDIATLADIPVEIIERERFTYVVYRVRDSYVVAVRGTVWYSLRDWWIDFNAGKSQAKMGKYHAGFANEAREACKNDLLPILDSAESIYFTGHSLGAAVASILAQIWPSQSAVAPTYVFASPRFGTKEATSMSSRTGYRRPADPVPRVPPKFLGFSHMGTRDQILWQGGPGRRLVSVTLALPTAGLSHHGIGGIRSLLGNKVGENFAADVYEKAINNI